MEIGHGIEIYHGSPKKLDNTVFFSDDQIRRYPAGGMLFEVISDDSFYLMIEKSKNMIKAYPDYGDEISIESIIQGFQWLYDTVEDDERPVTTELFRSGFNLSISEALKQPNILYYSSVGDLFLGIYDIYLQSIELFSLCFDALAKDNSGSKDPENEGIVSIFKMCSTNLIETYKKPCREQYIEYGTSIQETDCIQTLLQLLVFECCMLKEKGKIIKICQNCGRYFIPPHRNDTIYCQFPSPQNPLKTCKEIGPQIKRDEKRRSNPDRKERDANYARLLMSLKRAKDSGNSKLSDKIKGEMYDLEKKYKWRTE